MSHPKKFKTHQLPVGENPPKLPPNVQRKPLPAGGGVWVGNAPEDDDDPQPAPPPFGDLDRAIGRADDRAICAACRKEIINTGLGFWDHVGIAKPRHIATPKDDMPDDPKPAIAPAVALEILTLAMVRTLAEAGVDPGECAATAFDIRNRWMTALGTKTDAP